MPLVVFEQWSLGTLNFFITLCNLLLFSPAEFKRAVKVATGTELSENVLDTVFKIFDLDGDNCLSHGEFLGVLKNRLHRGLKVMHCVPCIVH